MTTTGPNAPLPGGDPLKKVDSSRVSGQRSDATSRPESADAPAFKALLDKLEQKARELEAETRGVDDASHLAGAVEGAKSSLEDALSLGEELLESFRQNRQQTSAPPTDTPER